MSQLALLVDGVVSRIFTLEEGKVTIGRSPQSDICIDDVSVSTHHAVIEMIENPLLEGHYDVYIEDLESRNGTLVNAKPVQRCRLNPDDVITVGWNKFKLLDDRNFGRDTTALIVLD